MKAKPLTKRESDWLKKLEAVMNECPSTRLQCYTIGDNDLTFYDKQVSLAWENANPRAELDAGEQHEKAGSALATVRGNFQIDSCAG